MRLPNPVELANRLEEARTSAKLLEQLVACTPPSEVLSNDLIKEFADRCLSASRSIQGYMSSNPSPDNDTMESLIDTNEQLQQALNGHQRSVLNAKKQLGLGERPSDDRGGAAPDLSGWVPPAASGGGGGGGGGLWHQPSTASASSSQRNLPAPPLPSRKVVGNGKGKASDTWEQQQASVAGPSRSATGTPHHDEDDPFRDPQPEPSASSYRPSGGGETDGAASRYAYEPYHPGFKASDGEKGGNNLPDPVTPVSDDGLYDNDDAYRATPGKKSDAVYRY